MSYDFCIGVIGSATTDIQQTLRTNIGAIRHKYPSVKLRLIYSFRSPLSFRKQVINVAAELGLSTGSLDEVNSDRVPGNTLGTICDGIILIGTDNPISVGVVTQFEQRSKGPVYRHDH